MNLNSEQIQAVQTTEGPLLIAAAPGSGKTRIITERVLRLLDIGVAPDDILAITFTNAAAGEMRTRLAAGVEEDILARLTICTFHKLAIKIIREYGFLIGYKKGFSIYDENDQLDILKSVMQDLNIKDVKPEKVLKSKDHPKFKIVFKEYEQRLKAANAFDYDGLIETAVALLEIERVKADLSYKYRYIHVDEFQDTNHLQYKLVSALASKWNNLCVVGDGNQAIYGFQGADVKWLLSFGTVYPQAKTVTIDTVYRCPNNVLSLSNELIKNNTDRLITNPKTDNGPGEYQHMSCDSPFEEAAWIASTCKNLVSSGTNPSQIAVLYRTHRLRAEIESTLKKAGFEINVCGKTKHLMQETAIREFHSYLRLFQNPNDIQNFRRVASIGEYSMSWKDIVKCEALATASDVGCLEACVKYLAKENRDFVWASDLLSISKKSFMAQVFDTTTILSKFYGDKKLFTRVDLLSAVNSYIKIWMQSGRGSTLDEYLSDLSELGAQEDLRNTTPHNGINLLTIHTAKGLEFDVVFVAGLEQGTLPINYKNDKDLQEERRLFYVAITRAKKALFTSYSRTRYFGDNEREMEPSEFLKEIGGA
jgi:DNA helicase-2/ATP-dependent DNA helicase PcrA